MNISHKSALLVLASLSAAAHATDVTSISSTNYPNGWYISDSSGSSTASLDLMPSNDGDGALHFGGATGNNGKKYVSYGALPASSGAGFASLGTLAALSTGSVSADLFRSSSSVTPNAATNVVVKLVFSGNRQLTWENAYNGNVTTQDSWFSQMMAGNGVWWIRGASATGTANFDTAGNFKTLSDWATGFTPAGYTGGSLLGADVLGFTVGFGSGVGNFNGAIDHLALNFTGGNQYAYNFQAVPEPSSFAAFALGGLALLRRRKRAN